MYLLLAICSMLAYAVQITFMARYFRRFDPLLATALRGLSLGLSMLPVLLLAADSSFFLILAHPWLLLSASFTAALGNWSAAQSFRYLPVGIASACQQGMLILVVTIIGYVFFGENITLITGLGILLLLAANILAVLPQRRQEIHADRKLLIGVLCCLCFGVIMAISFSLIAQLSRLVDPFVAGYCWEFTIGIIAALMVLARSKIGSMRMPSINAKAVFGIFAASSPTVIGTACYSWAVTLGPFAIATAIGSTVAVATAALSYFVHAERLSARQISAIVLVVIAIFIIKTSGI